MGSHFVFTLCVFGYYILQVFSGLGPSRVVAQHKGKSASIKQSLTYPIK